MVIIIFLIDLALGFIAAHVFRDYYGLETKLGALDLALGFAILFGATGSGYWSSVVADRLKALKK